MSIALLGGLAACHGDAWVAVEFDVPEGALAPASYASIEVRIRTAARDDMRTVPVVDGAFQLGDLSETRGAVLEAKLLSATGGLMAYGRHPGLVDLVDGASLVVPVRRPLVYLGASRRVSDRNPDTLDPLALEPAAYVDLSAGAAPLGPEGRIATTSGYLTSASGALWGLDQAIDPRSGRGVGPISLVSVAASDHAVSPPIPLPAELTGAIHDTRASDDGAVVAVATQTGLAVVQTDGGAAVITAGAYSRVVFARDALYAIVGRAPRGPCNLGAQLVRHQRAAPGDAAALASGGFLDLASNGDRVFALDCGGQISEVTDSGLRPLRGGLSGATAIAVSGDHLWFAAVSGGVASIASFPLDSMEPALQLWSEAVTQKLTASDYPGVVRNVAADAVFIDELELGAGGEFISASVLATYDEPAIPAANFPQFTLESDELWVLDASSGAVDLRYRTWCSGVSRAVTGQITGWACAEESGQLAAHGEDAHRLRSMTFAFGSR
ncbi:MAG: hypothetical protein R3B48_07540 [Kofleriaceae bacterium]